MRLIYPGCLLLITLLSCAEPGTSSNAAATAGNKADTPLAMPKGGGPNPVITTGATAPAELVGFARSLTGTPYKYGSIDPQQGFDCSGFVTYVFNHFNIAVPRSSVNFTDVQRSITLREAKTGDLILFTGTDSTRKTVGHMGILIANTGEGLKFIHATSGKAYGVTETPLNAYYQGRYLKTIRIFPQNDR